MAVRLRLVAIFNALIFALFAAAVLWRYPWESIQFLIVLAFAAAGFFLGSALSPGNRIAEGLVALPAILVGFLVARWATKKLARVIDRAGPSH